MTDISATYIDDRSPDVVYHGHWQPFDDVPASFDAFNNTLTYSSTNGSIAALDFTGR